ncbi:MAG TPA: hypothetical protein VMJ75_22090 [Candidatus Acidoferrales bacterium]|nr:hypothetical protein [Candidatus Acidoferrales bacterium]
MRRELRALILMTAGGLGLGQSRPAAPGVNGVGEWMVVDVYLSDRDDSSVLLAPGAPVASGIFARIGVRLRWHAGELPWSRGTGHDRGVQAAFGIRTVGRAPESASATALASAEVSGVPGPEITVYRDRVRRFLADHAALQRAAAGYVLAHELAHVMAGEPHHSDQGILKPQWSKGDMEQMVLQRLAFTDFDVESIRAGLAIRLANQRAAAGRR